MTYAASVRLDTTKMHLKGATSMRVRTHNALLSSTNFQVVEIDGD